MRVVIAEDSVLLREGIARILEAEAFDIVGQAGTAADAGGRCPRAAAFP
jgi:DNA-binding NarL/FixJ family response regulator